MIPVNVHTLAKHLVQKPKYLETAHDLLRDFTRHHRIQLSSELRKALDVVKRYLNEHSIEAKIYMFDPNVIKDSFITFGWELEKARIEIVSPEGTMSFSSDDTKLLAVAHSPSGIASGEITLMEKDQDLADRIVIITENHRVNYLKAIERNASAVIFTRKTQDPGAFPYFGLFISKEILETKGIPAVSLPWAYSRRIIRSIKRGEKVNAIVEVKSRFVNEKVPALVAKVGDSNPNIMGFAHSCHPTPGAHDNGSGVVGLFLALLYLKDILMVHGIKGSFTAIFAPEYSGSLAYVIERQNDIRTMGVINLDMIGSTSIDDPIKVSHGWIRTPSYVEPSFYVAMRILESTPGSRLQRKGFKVTSYSSGSDHDIFNFYGVPSFHVFQGIDPYYHTSSDRLENVDMLLVRDIAIGTALLNVIVKEDFIKDATRMYYEHLVLTSIGSSVENIIAYKELIQENKIPREPLEEYSPQENITGNPLLDKPLTMGVILERYGPEKYNAISTRFERREISDMLFYVLGHMRSGFNVKDIGRLGRIDLGISEEDVLTLLEVLDVT